MYELLTIFFIN